MISQIFSDSGFLLSLRWVLAVVFLVGLVHKLRSPGAFVTILEGYRLLPQLLVAPIAWLLIVAELLAAILLLMNTQVGSAIAFGLFVLYTTAIALNLLRGRRDIDCGCAGPAVRQTLSGSLVVRNTGLILVTLLTFAPASSRGLVLLDWFTALAAALSFALLYLAASLIVALPGRTER